MVEKLTKTEKDNVVTLFRMLRRWQDDVDAGLTQYCLPDTTQEIERRQRDLACTIVFNVPAHLPYIPSIRSCVYFLVDQGEIVYVGQTGHPQNRVKQHARKKIFNQVAILALDESERTRAEAIYIEGINPKYNRTSPNWRTA